MHLHHSQTFQVTVAIENPQRSYLWRHVLYLEGSAGLVVMNGASEMGGKTHVMVVRESQGHQHSVLSDFLVIVTRPTCLGGEMYQYNTLIITSK